MRRRAPVIVLFAVLFTPTLPLALRAEVVLFNFSASSGGTVAAEYSAEGKFSVGMNGNCFDL